MCLLLFFMTKFFQYNNLLYKLFLFLCYWYSTKYCKTLCFHIFTLSCHITINNLHSQWEAHNLFTLEVIWIFIKNFACCFFSYLLYFTRWVSQILSLHVHLIPKFFYATPPTAIFDWLSFWYSGNIFWFLWKPESI